MGYEINIDKYSFAKKPDPESTDESYSSALARKLVCDEAAERKSGIDGALSAVSTEAAARQSADDEISKVINNEVRRATAIEQQLKSGKVDKENGKGLSANDFTDAYKAKLDGLSNYDDAEVKSDISDLKSGKVDKISDMGLSKIKNISKTEQPCVLDDGSKGWITNISIIDQNDEYKNITTFYELDTLDTLLSKKTDKPTLSDNTLEITINTNANDVNVPTVTGMTKEIVTLQQSMVSSLETLNSGKADKSIATEYTNTSIVFNLYEKNNHIDSFVSVNASSLSIAISDGEYPTDYTASLSFKTGSAAPETSYTANSNTLVWVGSECSVSGSSSVFAPIANKVYDIVFYFNGANFVGLVNGYSVPAEAEA